MPAASPKCVCVRARRASRSLTDLYDGALRPAGIRITQFSALRNIERLQPVSISRLASEMALDRSTLGRNLVVLRRRGLVSFCDADDMRQWSIELSAKGRKVLDRALPLWESAQSRIARVLGKDSVARLFRLLERLEKAA